MITIAIVEDDKKSAKILQDYILRYSEEKQEPLAVECFENGLNFISDYKASCDIALMDIEMPHMNGLDTARKLREFDSQIPLIFITNMAQYAINGYEVQALDFMVKPIEYFNFSLKLDKAIRICKKLHGYQIYVPSEQGTVKIGLMQKKGYGFISDAEGNDIFVHFSALNMDGFKELKDGEAVEFEVIEGDKGPQAANVTRLG